MSPAAAGLAEALFSQGKGGGSFVAVWGKVRHIMLGTAPHQRKFPLTDVGLDHTSSAVPPLLEKLIGRVRTATGKRGSRAALARLLGVERGVLNAWLSGRHQPAGEHTLQLLHWVEQQERGQR